MAGDASTPQVRLTSPRLTCGIMLVKRDTRATFEFRQIGLSVWAEAKGTWAEIDSQKYFVFWAMIIYTRDISSFF